MAMSEHHLPCTRKSTAPNDDSDVIPIRPHLVSLQMSPEGKRSSHHHPRPSFLCVAPSNKLAKRFRSFREGNSHNNFEPGTTRHARILPAQDRKLVLKPSPFSISCRRAAPRREALAQELSAQKGELTATGISRPRLRKLPRSRDPRKRKQSWTSWFPER